MTPEQRIKRHILTLAIQNNDDLNWEGEITAENVDEAWDTVLVASGDHWDFLDEFRSDGEDSGLPAPWSRHYESKSKACQLIDGTWVGWTYWYGGGKHGEPGGIDWLSEAYDVDVKKEVKIVNIFSMKDS